MNLNILSELVSRENPNENLNVRRKRRTLITKEIINQFLKLIKKNKTCKQISEELELSESTIKKMISKYYKGEFDDIKKFKTASIKKSENKKDYVIEKNLISNFLLVDNSLNINNLKYLLLQEGINCSKSKISKILKCMNYSRKRLVKVPIERNSLNVLNLREQYCRDIINISDNSLIFLDESGFDLHTNKNYGYSPKNIPAFITIPANKHKNISLMCALSISGIVAYELIEGAYNTVKFISFLTNKLIPIISNNRRIIVMDNCAFHKSTSIVSLLNSSGIQVKFLPPYSPQLNPIEEVFSSIKSRYKNIIPRAINESQLKENIVSIITNLNLNFLNFYDNMRTWTNRGISREIFIN